MTRDEVIAVIRTRAREVGRTPTLRDLHGVKGFREPSLYKHFDGMADALGAAGLKSTRRCGRSETSLLVEWAELARKLKRLPSAAQYGRLGRVTTKPMVRRFGKWSQVPDAFQRFAEQEGIEERWADVLEMIEEGKGKGHQVRTGHGLVVSERTAKGQASRETCNQEFRRQDGGVEQLDGETCAGGVGGEQVSTEKQDSRGRLSHTSTENMARRLRDRRPVYGDPLTLPGLAHAPVNEAGVVYLFALLARRLGFIVERMQAGFPDCEALCQVEPGKWQRVNIEFEYASRNFMRHAHRVEDCDVVVCWVHDWMDCPEELEIVELSRLVGRF